MSADHALWQDAHAVAHAAEPGVGVRPLQANELGLWRATDGKLTALANVGPANPREFPEVTSTTECSARS